MAGIRYNVNPLKGILANTSTLRWAFLGFLVIWFLVNLFTLSWYPALTISPDEAWTADIGLGFLRSGLVKTTMFPGTSLNDFGYGVFGFPVYAGALALSFKAFGITPFAARLVSLVGGILMLVSVYLIGKRLWSEKVGVLAAVIMGLSGAFVLVSHIVRPEALLAGFLGLAFYTAIRAREGRGWAIACGFLTALLPLVYVVGSLFSLAILTYFLVTRSWRPLLWFLVGLVAPAGFFLFYNIIPNLSHPPGSDVQEGYNEGFIPLLLLRNPPYAIHLYLQNLVFRNLHCIIGAPADNRTFYFVSSLAGVIGIIFSAYYWAREQRPLVILFISGLAWIALFPRGLAPPHSLVSFAVLFYPVIFPVFAGVLLESFWKNRWALAVLAMVVAMEDVRLAKQVLSDRKANIALVAAMDEMVRTAGDSLVVDRSLWWWAAPGRVRIPRSFYQDMDTSFTGVPGLFTRALDDPSLILEKKIVVPMRIPQAQPWFELDTLYLYVPTR